MKRQRFMIIRDAELRDARGIAEAHVRSWQAAYAAIVPDEDLAQLSVDAKACRNDGALSTLSARALMVR